MDLLDDESLIDLRRRAKSTDPAAVLDEERRLRSAPRPSASSPPPARPLSTTAAAVTPDGLCALCRARPARGTCAMCGRAACAADLWIMLRLCRSCANERAVERGQRPARPEAANWLAGGAGSADGGMRPKGMGREDGT